MPLVIDGYNLLWSVQKTGKGSESFTDVQLCHILDKYLKLIGDSGLIVFDGIGPPDKRGFDSVRGLEIYFVGKNTDADSYIEEKIRQNSAPRSLVIVSSDRRIRKAARTRKAISLKSEIFWADVQRELNRKNKDSEPPQKTQGLTEAETRYWLRVFGFEV